MKTKIEKISKIDIWGREDISYYLYVEDRIVGNAHVIGEELEIIYIDPQYRRRGLGEYLLKEIQKDCSHLRGLVYPEREGWFKQKGFIVVKRDLLIEMEWWK